MEQHFKVAAAHAAPVLLDTDACIEKACTLICEAANQNARLIVFPEVFVPGFPYWINCYPPLVQAHLNRRYQDSSIEIPGPEIARVQKAALAAGVAVVLGVSERNAGGRTCYNTQVFVERDGSILGIHRKLQPTYAERYIWGQGDGSTLSVFDSSVGRIGGLACWEHTMNLARQALIAQGIQLHAASWPSLSTMAGFADVADSQIESMMKAHALTGQCFVITASSPVTQQMIDVMTDVLGPQDLTGIGGGWSAIIDPFTVLLDGPHVGEIEHILTADVDLAKISSLKLFVDSAGHYSRPDVLELHIDKREKAGVVQKL